MLTLGQMWRLAQGWYADDRRDPGWRRKTIAEAHALFEAAGIRGPFWRL